MKTRLTKHGRSKRKADLTKGTQEDRKNNFEENLKIITINTKYEQKHNLSKNIILHNSKLNTSTNQVKQRISHTQLDKQFQSREVLPHNLQNSKNLC